jgi:hypothetical protein
MNYLLQEYYLLKGPIFSSIMAGTHAIIDHYFISYEVYNMATTRTAKKVSTATKTSPTKAVRTRSAAAVTKTVVRTARKAAVKVPVKSVVAKKPLGQKPGVPATKVVVPAKKVKLVRDSFCFPKHEHALLADLKGRAQKLGQEFKKSEILRAGIQHLVAMADTALMAALARVERVKTGRPAKKSKKK